jgi:hypothetical protein
VGEPTILAALEVASNGKGVRVEFTKVDRVISHTIYVVNDGEKTAVLESVSGNTTQPCFTEVHQQREMLFLTGADGPCHWSMSVESRQGSEIVFDVACRIKEPSLELSTEYSVRSTGAFSVEPFEGTKVEVDDSSVRIASTIVAPTTAPATVRWKYGVAPTR